MQKDAICMSSVLKFSPIWVKVKLDRICPWGFQFTGVSSQWIQLVYRLRGILIQPVFYVNRSLTVDDSEAMSEICIAFPERREISITNNTPICGSPYSSNFIIVYHKNIYLFAYNTPARLLIISFPDPDALSAKLQESMLEGASSKHWKWHGEAAMCAILLFGWHGKERNYCNVQPFKGAPRHSFSGRRCKGTILLE